ncbi:349_t:CDS:1, partial [Acaulospora morrowiae]
LEYTKAIKKETSCRNIGKSTTSKMENINIPNTEFMRTTITKAIFIKETLKYIQERVGSQTEKRVKQLQNT